MMKPSKSSSYLENFVPAKCNSTRDGEGKSSADDGLQIRQFYEELTKNGDSNQESITSYQNGLTPSSSNEDKDTTSFSKQPNKSRTSQTIENGKDIIRHDSKKLLNSQQRFRQTNNLFKSIYEGNLCNVKDILEISELSIDVTDQYKWTPLMCATASGNAQIVNYLLDRGASVYSPVDDAGMSAWDISVKLDKTEIIDIFFKRRVKTEKLSPEYEEVEEDSKELCNVCNVEYNESEREGHLSSTAHLFQQYKDHSVPNHYHLSNDNVGYRILKETGWTEDKGLGPEGKGERNPVATVLKRDRLGFGMKDGDRKRVTHFKANDSNAVKKHDMGPNKRVQKKISKRDSVVKHRKSKMWEMELRSYMNRE